MKIDYLSCRIVRSGGTKIIAQHVKLLRERGHEARILTTDPKGKELWGLPVIRVNAIKQTLFDQTDILVGSWIRDVEAASRIKGPIVCHLCQGYEPIEFSFRINEERIPSKYQYGGAIGRLLFLRKKWSFRRKVRKIEKIYRLPTVKITVSRALKEVLEKTHGGICHVIPNGIDSSLFKAPEEARHYGEPLRILSIGPMDMVFKGIHDSFEAIRILKEKGIPVEFIRVSISPPTRSEIQSGLVDRFLRDLEEEEMADLYQKSHVLLAPSLWEGFGLPVIEAMSCGVPCILTDSGSYKFLDRVKDFACFVPPHSPGLIAEGVVKLKEDPGFRGGIIRRGHEVANRYSLENMGNVLEQTLSKIWKSRKKS